jgi:hypothetical protein
MSQQEGSGYSTLLKNVSAKNQGGFKIVAA